ncbi:hypothetical protein GCM10028833_16470 [Glycomyces tarimensis]
MVPFSHSSKLAERIVGGGGAAAEHGLGARAFSLITVPCRQHVSAGAIHVPRRDGVRFRPAGDIAPGSCRRTARGRTRRHLAVRAGPGGDGGPVGDVELALHVSPDGAAPFRR